MQLMPIRVLLDGADVIAPMSEPVFESLRQRVRAKEITLLLPCCKGTGYPRLSPRGLQHFAHHHNDGCEPETEEHIAAKLQIVEACRAGGVNAIPEYVGDGWRADVFVKARAWEACFEVQWSSQSFQETLRRQKVYKDHGVRCCWLFRDMPTRQTVSEEHRDFKSQLATPMFELRRNSSFASKPTFDVEVNGTRRSLPRFVNDLLSKRLRYSRSSIWGPISATISVWRVFCTFCRWRPMHFFYVSDVSGRALCGAQVKLVHHRYSKLFPKEYEPILSQFVQTLPGGLAFNVREHDSHYNEFVCPTCGNEGIIEKPPSKTRGLRREWDSRMQTRLQPRQSLCLNHWCDSPRCSVDTGIPSELQDILSMPGLEWERAPERRYY